MKILLLGNTGQLGWELNRTLLTLDDLIALDYPQIDMSDPDSIRSVMRKHEPDLVINATAYTNVNKAESEPELAMAINGTGPGVLAEEAKRSSIAIIHYSTDYVFDGTKGTPYIEEDQPNPLSVYGKTKLAGEEAVQAVGGAYLLFRTSWVYSLRRPCFVTKVLQWARERETLRIVDDQISTPTWARSLAQMTTQVMMMGIENFTDFISKKAGLYHLSENGLCSRFEWAKAILEEDPDKIEQVVNNLSPAKSEDFDSLAARPTRSTLSCEKFTNTFGFKQPHWHSSLKLAMRS